MEHGIFASCITWVLQKFLFGTTFADQDCAKTTFREFVAARAPSFFPDVINQPVLGFKSVLMQTVLNWTKSREYKGSSLEVDRQSHQNVPGNLIIFVKIKLNEQGVESCTTIKR